MSSLNSDTRAGALAQRSGMFPFNIVSGLTFVTLIAALAVGLAAFANVPALSPLVIALCLGLLINNTVGVPVGLQPGIGFSARTLLRAAIVLLGAQVTLRDIAEIGPVALAVVGVSFAATYALTVTIGRLLRVEARLAELIGAGTSVCGASAILAMSAVNRAREEDVAYAIACVTLFGTICLLLYPLGFAVLHVDPKSYGIWTGASVHEVAQVAGAGFQAGQIAGEASVITKLTRILMLAPLLLVVSYTSARDGSEVSGRRSRVAILPWFVTAFLGVILINSFHLIPIEAKKFSATAFSFFLTMTMAAVGVQSRIVELKNRGLRPLLVGACASAFISVLSGILIAVFV